MSKTLDKLPWSVVRRLTQLLDRPFPKHHNWSTFLEHAEVVGTLYAILKRQERYFYDLEALELLAGDSLYNIRIV